MLLPPQHPFWRWALALALGWSALPAQACGPYKLAFYEFGLMYYRDEQARPQGIDLDVVQAVSARSGCRFETWVDSRVRIWSQLASGQLDLSVSGIPTLDREAYAEFTPYIVARNMVVLRRNLPGAARDPEGFANLPELKVAVVKGFRHGAFYDAWLDRLRQQPGRVVETSDVEAVARIFKAGRVEAFLAQPTGWILAARRHGLEAQAELLNWAPLERVVGGLVVSRLTVSDADRRLLRSAVQSLVADGSLEQILRRHVGPELAASMVPPATGPER